MEVRGPGGVGGVGPVYNRPPQRVPKADVEPLAASSEDQVQISPIAKFLSQINELPEIREQKVTDARELIQKGQYETPERIDVAVDRLLAEIMGE